MVAGVRSIGSRASDAFSAISSGVLPKLPSYKSETRGGKESEAPRDKRHRRFMSVDLHPVPTFRPRSTIKPARSEAERRLAVLDRVIGSILSRDDAGIQLSRLESDRRMMSLSGFLADDRDRSCPYRHAARVMATCALWVSKSSSLE